MKVKPSTGQLMNPQRANCQMLNSRVPLGETPGLKGESAAAEAAEVGLQRSGFPPAHVRESEPLTRGGKVQLPPLSSTNTRKKKQEFESLLKLCAEKDSNLRVRAFLSEEKKQKNSSGRKQLFLEQRPSLLHQDPD